MITVKKFSGLAWGLATLSFGYLAYFSCLKPWTWGIADEPGLAMDARDFHKKTSFQEWINYFRPVHTGGRFNPLVFPYLNARFALLSTASGQHMLQVFMILSVLLLWVFIASAFDPDPRLIPLGLLFTLYFGPFSGGAMSFLSMQELPMLALISVALCCVVPAGKNNIIRSALFFACVIPVVFLKETAFALLVPLLVVLSGRPSSLGRNLTMLILGTIVVLFPIAMMRWVRGDYSASYQMSCGLIMRNGWEGLKQLSWTYKFCMPLLIVGLPLMIVKKLFNRFDALCLIGTACYFLVLTPWTGEMTYYHAPLGPFIGFLTARAALAIIDAFPRRNVITCSILLGIGMLAVASVFRQAHRIYSFNAALGNVQDYLVQHLNSEHVYLNGEEASVTVPQGMSLRSGKHFGPFVFAHSNTRIQAPAYVVIVTRQTRYPPPVVPSQARKVFSEDRWDLFYVAS
jgi:hypothetical protein